MKKILFILTSILFLGCGGPIKGRTDTTLYDRTYLIFLTDEVYNDGSGQIGYQIYKIDGDRNNFSSGNSGITAGAINLETENKEERDSVINDFKIKYPDTRIYLNHELYY